MLTACLFLYLEIRRFGGFGTVPRRVSAVERPDDLVRHDGHRVTMQIALDATLCTLSVIADWTTFVLLMPPAAASGCRAPSSRSRSNSAAGSSLHELELVDDVAGRLFFFDLLVDEPLELDQRRERLFLERHFVERVDLLRDALLLLERLLEHVGHRGEIELRLGDRLQLHAALPGDQEIVQPHRVAVLFLALQPHPMRAAAELLVLAVGASSTGSCTSRTARC